MSSTELQVLAAAWIGEGEEEEEEERRRTQQIGENRIN